MRKPLSSSTLFSPNVSRVELELLAANFSTIVGCDEAGRGPLAGPVVGAAVVFRDCDTLWKCRDSKSISAETREALYDEIKGELEFSVVRIEPSEIDVVNIRVASLTAMSRSATELGTRPSVILVDGRDRLPGYPESRAIVKGDSLVATISAASIIAKVTRDQIMRDYHLQYPVYGFNEHFGYPTARHREALRIHGPCPIHRKSYKGVRELIETPST